MIDWGRVNELRNEVGEEDFEEVVELFLEEVDEVIDRLRATPDLANLESDMHFLKGSALNLGFQSFSEICRKGERAAAMGQAKEFAINDVFQNYDTSRNLFLASHQPQNR